MTDANTNVPAGTNPAVVSGDTGKGFDMSDVRGAFHDAVESIEMGDDGSLDMQIRPQEPVVETPESDGPSEPPETPLTDTPEYATEDLLAEIDTWEERYKNLQGAYTSGQQTLKEQGERIARLEGKLEAGVQTPPQDDADPWADPATQSASDIDALVAQRVDAALKDQAPSAEVEELVQDWKIGKELQEVIAAHDDFPAYVPAIQKLLDTVATDLSYEEAYQIARQFGVPAEIAPAPSAPAAAPAPVADTPAAAQPQAATHDELVARANALKTAQGDTNDAGFVADRAVESPRDAIMQALEDTYGS